MKGNTKFWIAADGRMFPICRMMTSHIKHCVAKINRDQGWRAEYLPRLKAELEYRAYRQQAKEDKSEVWP